MRIWTKPYRKRDGEFMVYLNNDRGVSLGISQQRGYQSSKASRGEKNLWEAFCEATKSSTPVATGAAMSKHHEEFFLTFNDIAFAITDVATVGGVPTGSDGLFVVRDGNVFNANFSN